MSLKYTRRENYLRIINTENDFLFYTDSSNISELKHFVQKKDNNFTEVRPFSTQKKSPLSLRKWFFQTNETNIGYFHFLFLFLVFAAEEGFFDKFLWLRNQTRNANSSFRFLLKKPTLKITLQNQHLIHGRLATMQVRHWFETFRFVFVIWLQINLCYFCFRKLWNIFRRVLRKRTV